MGANRRILFLAGLAVFLTLLGLWLALTRTERGHGNESSAAPGPTRSARQHNVQASEVSEPAPTTAPPAAPGHASLTNAADLYRKAFTVLEALSKDEKDTLRDWKAEADPLVAAKLCGKLAPIVGLAHEAGAVTNCDWGLGEITFYTPLPHLNSARSLAQALVWNAAHCRPAGSGGRGDDLEATLRLGECVSQMLIGHLVNTAIQGLVMDYLCANAPALPPDAALRMVRLFEDGQYEESVYRGFETEAEIVDRLASRLASVPPNQLDKEIQAMFEMGLPEMDPTQVAAALREVAAMERAYVQTLNGTEAQYQAWLEKISAAEQTNPFLRLLLPAHEAVVDKTRAVIVRRAMMAAGLALLQDGPNALLNHPDPASGRPFVYRLTSQGFELESVHPWKGQPVTMSFRTR